MIIQKNRENWIKTLHKLRLHNLAATFLEASGPVNLLGAQLVYLTQPVLSPFVSDKQSRDFAYINNVVEANFLAIKATGVAGHVFNVAGGKEHSILDLVDSLNEIMGKAIKPEFLPIRTGDVFRTLADISKAEKLLGYKPKVDFKEGLKQTVDHFRKVSEGIVYGAK